MKELEEKIHDMHTDLEIMPLSTSYTGNFIINGPLGRVLTWALAQ